MKSTNKIILLLLLTALALPVFAQKMILGKSPKTIEPRIHPYEQLLSRENSVSQKDTSKSRNNRLLVIMVDFQEEVTDDPETTGNGKFELTADASYKTTIASPPHNQEYYRANLEALRYYYLAASRGGFDLQYDIYPRSQLAYTLPEQMSYYNPSGASGELFLARIEEYFKTAFETADAEDTEINFGAYSHFMIIHAGSDWQHDILGDTPSDLPSFFINIADGKEAVVDGGAVRIYHACNVPSTISQDFSSSEENGIVYYSGYGALNGVLAHEFGHSIGFVDLYNTYNFRPMVGQFDIMDSGGSGVSVVETYPFVPNEYVLVEGVQPCLPGAFSTMLAFGDAFKANGLLKEIEDVETYSDLSLTSSSKMQIIGNVIPTIYKIPLNEKEYILVENRSIDADGDGGTAVNSDLDRRVILYPTAIDDTTDAPTYEYDYLLPSFIASDGSVAGGGIIVWHVDENVIYDMGVTDSQGNFVSNYDNNTVNGRLSRRGVKVIEADALDDIGNDYSWFWTGTPFEYFHKYKPNLNAYGQFINWTTLPWRPELNAGSVPALKDFSGKPSFYGLKDISQPDGTMTFQVSAGSYDDVQFIAEADTANYVLPVINSNLAPLQLPVLNDGILHFYTLDPQSGLNDWTEILDTLSIDMAKTDYEPVTGDFDNNGYSELYLVNNNTIKAIQISNDVPEVRTLRTNTPNESFTCAPLVAFGRLYAPTTRSLHYCDPALPDTLRYFDPQVFAGINQLTATDEFLVALRPRQLLLAERDDGDFLGEYTLPEDCTKYTPVTIKDHTISSVYSYYVTANSGNIYMCKQGKTTRIFTNSVAGALPTNLAVSALEDYSPCLVFALKDCVYAMKTDGTMLPGYPLFLEGYAFEPESHIIIRAVDILNSFTGTHIMMLRLDNGGYLAVDSKRSINVQHSITDVKAGHFSSVMWDEANTSLRWFFVNNRGNVTAATEQEIDTDLLAWNGFRNGGIGMAELSTVEPVLADNHFNAYAFPNPVTGSWLRIRVENSAGNNKLKIYNIAGNLIYQETYPAETSEIADLQADVSRFASGVYIAVVEQGNNQKRIKFAIQK